MSARSGLTLRGGGLRQGCVLSPLMLGMFFTALCVVAVRLSEDEGIVHSLVQLDYDGAGRVEEPLACVGITVWGYDSLRRCRNCREIGRGAC